MGIVLMILKIIGIVLLCILGLILLILLLVLFTPISYRVKAEHNDENTMAQAKFGFLVVNGKALYEKGQGFNYFVKVLFFKILPGKEEEEGEFEEGDVMDMDDWDEEDETPLVDDSSSASLTSVASPASENEEQEPLEPDFSYVKPESKDSISGSDESDGNEAVSNQIADDDSTDLNSVSVEYLEDNLVDTDNLEEFDNTEEALDDTEEYVDQNIEAEVKPSLGEKIDGIMGKATDKFEEITDKADEKIDELDKKYEKAMTKYDHVMQFLERDYVERTIKRALKILKRLFGTIKPKKSKGYVHFGLGSSADTGMMLGKVSSFYPLYGRWLVLDPDFYNKGVEGDIDIKGRIYLFRIVGPALRMVLTRDFWRTYKLAKKI